MGRANMTTLGKIVQLKGLGKIWLISKCSTKTCNKLLKNLQFQVLGISYYTPRGPLPLLKFSLTPWAIPYKLTIPPRGVIFAQPEISFFLFR